MIWGLVESTSLHIALESHLLDGVKLAIFRPWVKNFDAQRTRSVNVASRVMNVLRPSDLLTTWHRWLARWLLPNDDIPLVTDASRLA